MWTKQQVAMVLAAAAIFLAIGLLLFPPVAQPATPPHPTADRVAALLEKRTGRSASCVRLTGSLYRCQVSGRDAHGKPVCARAVFQWSALYPKAIAYDPATLERCRAASKAPPA